MNVSVLWQCCGKNENDVLTAEGKEQVTNKAQKVIDPKSVHFAISSVENHTRQTLLYVMSATDNERCIGSARYELLFGYSCFLPYVQESWPYEDFLATMAQRKEVGEATDLASALEIWPPARICRVIYLAALELWIGRVLRLPEMAKVEEPVIYIAGHPSASYCATDVTIVPGLVEPGGIIRYEIVLRPEFQIVSAEHVTADLD